MPMAGRGSRFFENGFVMPKPLIEINDRPFFYWATQSIAKFVDCADITFVVLEEHIRDHAIDREIKTYYPDAKIVALPEVTEGAAITALRGTESLPDDEPLLFNDCDHLFLCKPFNEFCKAGDFANGPDGALLTFASDSPAYSYLQYGADGRVCHTVEKQVVSHDAICGAYYFKNKQLYASACAEYLVNDLLRHRACGCRNAGHLTLGYLIHQRITAHIEQGKLLCHDRGILQTQLDLILAAFNKIFCHFGND